MAGNQTSEQGYKINITRAEIGNKEQVKSNIQTTLNSFDLSVGVNIHLSQDVNRESLLKELHTKVKGLSVNLTANTKLLIQQVDSAMGSLKHRYADPTYALKIKADAKTIESQVSAAVNAGIKTGFTTVKPEDTRLPIAATVTQPAISTADLTAVVNEVAKLQKVTSAAPSEIRLSDGSLKTVEKNLTDVIVTLELLYDLIESKSASTEILDSTKFNALLDNLSKQNHLYEQQEKLLDSLKCKHIENVKAQATLTPGTTEYAAAEKETAASRSAYILAANKLGLDVETKKIKFELLSIDEKAAQKSAQRTQQLQKEKENQKELNQLIKQYRSEQNKLLSLTGKNDSQEYKQVQANVAKAKAEINKYMNDANNKVSAAQKTSTNQTLNDIDAQFNSDKMERERRNLDSLIEKAKAYRMSIEKLNSMERKTRGMTIYDDQIKNSQEYTKFTAEINTATQALQQMNAVREKIKQHGGLATQQEYEELARLSRTYEDAKLNAEQYFAVWQNRNADFLSNFKEQDKLAKIGSNLSRYMGEYEAKLRKIPALYKRIISLQESLNNGSITSNRAATELNNIQTEARAAGVEVTTLWDRMKKSFKGNFRGAIANMGWMLLYSTVRQLTQNVIQLDTAMTELRKVTNETEKTYTQFLDNAETRAKSLGATLVDTVSATSDFARLGYGIKQAETLADSALIYANVGDGVDSIDTASSTLISTMQGFDIEADNVMTIVDKFNEVANKYAASAADIGEITKRAASAMSVAGNSLDQTIALGVAANTTVQDADTVGTALRTMSARIRGAKSDLESWGEDTSDLADSTSKLRNEIKALSGVDIMLDEQTFKSSYDILIEIGKQWDNLTDVSRSNIAQLMFGKQQLNVGLSILQDVELAEQILKTSEDSFGSATKENEIYLDSIQGRISQTSASWQSLSNNILDDDVVKQAVTGFNTILSLVNELLDKAGLLPTVLAGMGTVWAQHNRVGAFQNGDVNPLKAIFTGYKGESGTIVTGNDVDLLDKAGDVVKKYQMRVMDLSVAQKELEDIQKAGSDELAKHIDAVNIGTDSYKKYGNQAVFTGTGLKGLGTTLHAVGTEVLKGIGSFVAMQLALIAISKIIEGAIYLYNKYSMSVKATAKRAEESASALESTKTEIEDLNKELDTMQERMAELRAIGSLSITEQEELTRLKLESSELQKQIKLLQERQKLEEKQLIKDNINAVKAIDKRHNITHTDEATGEEYEVNTDLRGEFEIRANRINQYHAALKTLSETDENYQEKAQEYLDKIDEEEKAIADLSLQISEYKVALDDVPAAEKSYFEQLYKAENKALLATGTMSIMDFISSSLSDAEFESFNNKVSDMAANFADAAGEVTDIETRLKNLSTTEKDYIDNILPDFKLLSDEEIEKQFEKLEKGGNVKLALRPEIDTSLLAEKGWEDVGEGIATVFSSTYANEAGNIAANFTPILADENGKYIDVLSEESLQRYAEGVIVGVHDDYLNLQIGGEFTGTDAISQAEAAAEEIHKLQDYYYNGTSSQLYDALDAAGELDKVIDALAKNEGIAEFQSSFEDVISVLVNDVGYSTEEATDAILEHIRSMRNMGQVIENIANSDEKFSHITEKIDEITSTDFDIDASSVTETLGSDFIDALDEAGVSVSDLCTWLDTLQEKIDNATITDATTELADVEESLNDLSDAYYEFVDNDGKVSSATLKGLSESFEGLEDTNEFEQFIKVLGNSKSTLTEVRSAMDNLVDVYFLQQAALGSLTEDDKALYVSQLQRLGVTNAEEVATQKIAVATIMALSAKDQLTDAEQKQLEAAQKVVNSLYSQDSALQAFANSALTAEQKADLLSAQEEAMAGNKFSDIVTNHASVLALVAEAAGLGAEGVLEYASALELVDKYEKYIANPQGGSVSPNVASAYAKAKETIANRQSTIDQLQNLLIGGGGVTADYTPVRTSESKDKGKSQEDKNKEAYDDAKARLDNLLERNKISYREYYKKLTALGNKYLKGSKKNMREHYATLADVRRDAYDHYQEVLDKSLDNGSLTLRQYREKSKALAKEWLKGRVSNEQDYADAVEEIYDKLNEAWKDRISEMETQMERWTLDRTWDPDLDKVKVWQDELKQLDSDYRNGLFDSEEEYFDLRYDLLERIDEATKESYDNELDLIEEKQDAIQELIDLTSDMLKQEKEDLIDALEDQLDVYEEICDKKRESLKLAKEENEYQRELEEENATLAELQAKAAVLALDDSRTGKAAYQEILKEIKEQQQTIADKQADHTYDASVDAIDKAEEAYKESIEKQVESINDLLDHAGKWLEYVYDYIKTTQPSELFKQLKDYNYQYGTGMSTDVEDIKKASADLLTQFNSNVPEILKSLKNRQTEIEDSQKKTENKEDDTPSDNYKSKLNSSLSKQVQSSETKKNSNYQNRKLVTQIKKDTGFDSWYDEDLKVIYMGSEGDRRITAGAYNTIEKMRELNDSKGTKKEKESQMNTLLAQLQAKWSYKNAFLKWNGNKAQLWKTNNMQIFHDGLAEGFVKGDTYTPLPKKQKEVYALLQSNELVMNNRDQHMLLTKLSVLSTLTDSLKKMQLENVPTDLSSMNNITVEVNAPITIEGSADKDTIKELEKFKKNLSNDVLGEVTTAMKRRGYGANTAVNARRK